jgi:hypothetical protein
MRPSAILMGKWGKPPRTWKPPPPLTDYPNRIAETETNSAAAGSAQGATPTISSEGGAQVRYYSVGKKRKNKKHRGGKKHRQNETDSVGDGDDDSGSDSDTRPLATQRQKDSRNAQEVQGNAETATATSNPGRRPDERGGDDDETVVEDLAATLEDKLQLGSPRLATAQPILRLKADATNMSKVRPTLAWRDT